MRSNCFEFSPGHLSFQGVAESAGVKTLPTFQVWTNGEVLEVNECRQSSHISILKLSRGLSRRCSYSSIVSARADCHRGDTNEAC